MKEKMKIAILGFDREGRSSLAFLKKSPHFKHSEIWILDRNTSLKIPRNVQSRLGKGYLKDLKSFDLVLRTPGIAYTLPALKKARRAGVEFSSATKLFFEEARRKHVQVIGITGTKGKGTTATLLYTMMRAAFRLGSSAEAHSKPSRRKHKRVFLAGNIGAPMLNLFPKLKKNDIIILELSSFQLQDLETSPHTAVILDIFPDHQDVHLNLKEYYEAKTNLARHQKREDRIFFFKNHPLSRWVAKKSRGTKIPVDEKSFHLFRREDLKIPGYHNFKNAVMAASVAQAMGVPARKITEAAKRFRGNEHRLEFVRKIEIFPIRQAQGKNKSAIYFYNDSAATIPEPTAAAIASFPGKQIILIAGGRSKVKNYAPIAKAVKRGSVPLVVLYGENKKIIARAIRRSTKQEGRILLVKNMKQALKNAYGFAKKFMLHDSLFIILFSPGSQSFDQFKNYADRGEQFKKCVRGLS